MKRWLSRLALSAGWALAAGGCAAGSSGSADFDSKSAPTAGGSNGSGAEGQLGSGGGMASDGGLASLPAETKVETAFQSPVATGQVVWTANPTSGRVAYINATSFDVKTVQAGDGPTFLAAVPDPTDDVAIVLNVLSQDATLLRDHAGVLSAQTFPASPNANAWAVSQSGRWAIAWTDTSQITGASPIEGFQDIEVIDLSAPLPDGGAVPRPPTDLIVGFRPVQVVFAEPGAGAGSVQETRAFAVTQDGISVIDLVDGSQPQVIASYPLA
jgi:hypothetical protein